MLGLSALFARAAATAAVHTATIGALLLAASPALAQTTRTGGGKSDEVSGGEAIGIAVVLLLFVLFIGLIALAIFLFVRYILRRNKQRVTAVQAYAQERGLVYEGDGKLAPVTPLLKRRGVAQGIVSGNLAGRLPGRLAGYRYSTGSGDNRRTYYYTTVLAPLPEAGSARLFCYRRVGGGLFDPVADALTEYQTVELESEQFSESFRLTVRDEANMIAIRQLFSPSFIVFLTEQVPSSFWFELEGGHLMAAVEGHHWERVAVLDELCAAAAFVADHIRKDISERVDLHGVIAPPAPRRPPGHPLQPPPPSS